MSSQIRRRPAGAPTLAAIAEAAGVAVPTVSKVLNGRSDVSDATRQRVTDLLLRAGYPFPEPDPHRGAPPAGLVDLVVPGIEGSWATFMLAGVEEVVSEAGKDVVVTVAHQRPGTADWVDRLIARGSRGAVLALVTPSPEEIARLSAAGISVVLLDPGAEPTPGVPTVGATNWAGGYAATEFLLALGHRRIGVVGGLASHRYGQARIDGHRSAMVAAGERFSPELVRHGDWTRGGAVLAATRLLTSKRPPTAIFACSDRMALGVYEAAAARGLRIPEDLSVVGFDDLPEARWITPSLTTVRQPVREMGSSAARILLRLTEGQRAGTDRLELSTVLVERASTAPPRGPDTADPVD
ncbi:substrate-binding domain-containing protein [Nakamurella alba]|uniref:substrate-binding domain-containing protein n=1 Tax=Nakamurella alba TaxID=2665158 RepID=UPI002AC3507E|nr:substrate-binding domain-containing protein [Nakamurella alba]